jgi:2-polyprenyl-3-methyl-5-hydroxy-6-metoxy-1,4-benzoquinol methylase
MYAKDIGDISPVTTTEASERSGPATAPLEFVPVPEYYADGLRHDVSRANCCGKRIGILIITYNALTTLVKVLQRIPPEVWANVEEVAVFDDASQDATYELAFGLKTLRDLPKLNVIKHERNLGYGGNQKAGYQYFIERGFDIVVLLHGDGQYAPEILAHLYHPIVERKADAVFGSRMMSTYGGALKGGMPLYKFVGNRILSVFENFALGLNLTEFHSGYRAYNLHALKNLEFSEMTNDFHFDTEIIIKLNHQSYVITEVPIPTYYGSEICYVNGMRYAWNVARAVYRYRQTCRSVRRYPEFREYFQHYPIKTSQGSSHYYGRQWVGSNQTVLDLGCGDGLLAEQLRENGNRIAGVDALPEAARADVLDQYFSADLDQGIGSVIEQLGGRRFDRVLLLDILEHLKNPERLLEQCHAVLHPEGRLIVSVPNVANITVRLSLLLGSFNYTERGILDRTHLRFFSRRTARRLLQESGFTIHEEKSTVMPIELVLGLAPTNPMMRGLNRFLALLTWMLPGLFGYQVMFIARSRATQTAP